MGHAMTQFMGEYDELVAAKIELGEARSNSDCFVELSLPRENSLIRKMKWEMFHTGNDSC